MEEKRKRPGAVPFLLTLCGLAVLAAPFVPAFPCHYCSGARQEIRDWMREPYLKRYREDHPEAVAKAEADLRNIERNCGACFKGRISLKEKVFWSQR